MKLILTLCLAGAVFFLNGWAARADDNNSSTANVFASSPVLPATIKRVLVLPLANDESSPELVGGCQTLDSVLRAELIKTVKFEVVPASPEILRNCTGRSSWTGEELLPPNFLTSLTNVYGCDAVLFSQLTEFRSSEPLEIGWRLKLVDASNGKILWAADEIFDAANQDEAKAAQKYEKSRQPHQGVIYDTWAFLGWCIHTPTRSALDDQWNILHSPRYFGEYSVQKLLKTLPQR